MSCLLTSGGSGFVGPVERPKVIKKSNPEDRQAARRTSDDEKMKLRESRVRFSDDGPTTSGNTQGDADDSNG